ncbi:MAG: Uma2 family endonuclease [Acidimicrobiales bacterium]
MAVEVTSRPTWRFSIEDYDRMGEVGILGPDARVELIEGEVVQMRPIGPPHARCVNRLTAILASLVVQRRIVLQVQQPVGLPPRSEPEPDLSVLAWRDDFYPERPGPGDVLLAVEVADRSVAFDRNRKVPLYAAQGIQEVWLVDLPASLVEVYREPGPEGFAFRQVVRSGGSISPLAFPDLVVEAATFLD